MMKKMAIQSLVFGGVVFVPYQIWCDRRQEIPRRLAACYRVLGRSYRVFLLPNPQWPSSCSPTRLPGPFPTVTSFAHPLSHHFDWFLSTWTLRCDYIGSWLQFRRMPSRVAPVPSFRLVIIFLLYFTSESRELTSPCSSGSDRRMLEGIFFEDCLLIKGSIINQSGVVFISATTLVFFRVTFRSISLCWPQKSGRIDFRFHHSFIGLVLLIVSIDVVLISRAMNFTSPNQFPQRIIPRKNVNLI